VQVSPSRQREIMLGIDYCIVGLSSTHVAYHALSACASREKESAAVSRQSCARSRGRELELIWNVYQFVANTKYWNCIGLSCIYYSSPLLTL